MDRVLRGLDRRQLRANLMGWGRYLRFGISVEPRRRNPRYLDRVPLRPILLEWE
ncbi:MAG: hypothetical protein DMG17_25175 [Acidobacteria bacterium]|nr:MAG: hypothetical protein DMG17_25175 [Acidobacteriota bacterium]